MKDACVLVYCKKKEVDSNGDTIHWYGGYFHSVNQNQYVSHYHNGEFELTYNIEDAKVFTNSKECDECLEAMVATNPSTICVWSYDKNSKLCKYNNLYERWEREDSNKYRGYGEAVRPPLDFYELIREAKMHPSAQCVNYPNEYWTCNNRLQPSLINETVTEWHNRTGR